MLNRLIIAAAFASTVIAAPVLAGGTHAGGDNKQMAVGKPGKADAVDRTIEITMLETEDGDMLFEPSRIEVKQGRTIRFAIENDGVLEHEFVIGTPKANQKHKGEMAMSADMKHVDPNAIRLDEGEDGDLVWTFTRTGKFEFACLIPGHYEMGMHGPLIVAAK